MKQTRQGEGCGHTVQRQGCGQPPPPTLWSLHSVKGQSAPGQTRELMCTGLRVPGMSEGPGHVRPVCSVWEQERFVSEVGGGQGSFLGRGSIFTDFHFVGFP